MKGFSCVSQLFCVKPVTNVKNVASNLPVEARLQIYWQTWLDLGVGLKVVQILKEGYTLPFQIRPNLARSTNVIRCYVNPHRNLYLLEALHQLIDKNYAAYGQKRSRAGEQSEISGVFQLTIFSAQTQQQMETYSRSEQFKLIPQGSKFQNGDTGNHQNLPPTRRVGDLNRFQGRLLPHSNIGTAQEISEISCPGSDLPVQGTAIRFVHSTHGVHCNSKGGDTDGYTQGYKNPPVSRQLVPPNLSPAYTG